jgi:hypothetical protein
VVIKRKLGESDDCLPELAHYREREEREKGGWEGEHVLEKGVCGFQAAEKEIQLHEGMIAIVGFGSFVVEGYSIKMDLECVVVKL